MVETLSRSPSVAPRPAEAGKECFQEMVLTGGAPRPAGSGPDAPLAHLACALGGCLLEFAGRFQERRGQRRAGWAEVRWELEPRSCRLGRLEATLFISGLSSEEDCVTLQRLLSHCPVHQALEPGVALGVSVASPGPAAPLDSAGA